MRDTPRRVGRVLFGLAGVASALFVHFLPAPQPGASSEPRPATPPAALAPAVPREPAPASVPAVPYGPRRLRAEKPDVGPAAAPVLAVDGGAASEAAAPRAR